MKKFLLLLLSIAVLAYFFLPAFIYNELEFSQRKQYLMAEAVRKDVDELIELRSGRSESTIALSDQDKEMAMGTVEDGLKLVQDYAGKYQDYLQKQVKIPFLPKNYREYQDLKRQNVADYHKSIVTFAKVKEIEYQVFKLISQLIPVSQVPSTYDPEGDWQLYVDNVESAARSAGILSVQTDRMFEDEMLSELLYQYVKVQATAVTDYYVLIADPEILNNADLFEREMDKITLAKSQVDAMEVIVDWREKIVEPLMEQYSNLNTKSWDAFMIADEYYREHDLKNDPITRVLARFSKSYPRNI